MANNKVKLDANFAGFAVLHPSGPVLPGNEKRVMEDISGVLAKYYFPVVNIIYSAAGEARGNAKTSKIDFADKLKKLVLEGEVKTPDIGVADIKPSETEIFAPAKTAVTDSGTMLSESGGILTDTGWTAPLLAIAVPVLSGVGLILRTFFSHKEKGIVIPYLNGSRQFGWRRQNLESDSRGCEGIHYAQIILCVEREKVGAQPETELFVEIGLQLLMEWDSAGLQTLLWEKKGIRFLVPKPPKTPDIGDAAIPYNAEAIPLTLSEEEAAKLLGLPGRELPSSLKEVLKPIPGVEPSRYAKGVLLRFLGLK